MDEFWDVYDENRNLTGGIMKRSEYPRKPDEYHLVVHIWIKNDKSEWLISKRTPNKSFPLLWECTGGSALAGEDSLIAALREVKEELGISLNKERGMLFRTIKRPTHPDFCDVWVFEHNCSLDDIVFQSEETCDAMWATAEKIRDLMDKGKFVPIDNSEYILELIG